MAHWSWTASMAQKPPPPMSALKRAKTFPRLRCMASVWPWNRPWQCRPNRGGRAGRSSAWPPRGWPFWLRAGDTKLMVRTSPACSWRLSSLPAWCWPSSAPSLAKGRLIRRSWLGLVLVISGCQCGPTGRLTAIPEARLEIPDFQLGINCQEKTK